jgi:hypothetical protein
VKSRAILGWVLAIVLGVALQISIQPGTAATIILWAIVVLIAMALGLAELNSRGQPWKWLRGKIGSGPVAAPAPSEPPADPDEVFALAVDDLLDELGTITGRLQPVIEARWWHGPLDLPSEAYHRHKEAMSAKGASVRNALRDVYVHADLANRWVRDRTVHLNAAGQPISPTSLKKKANVAKEVLEEIRPGSESVYQTTAKLLPPRRDPPPEAQGF